MSKREPLVCEHLEHISRKALEKYQTIIRHYVRNRHGVYALYKRDKLYYVGLASDLQWRLKHHLKDRHRESWDTFSVYITIGDKHLKELEFFCSGSSGRRATSSLASLKVRQIFVAASGATSGPSRIRNSNL